MFFFTVLFQNEGVKFVQFIYNNMIYDEYQLRILKNGHTRIIKVKSFVCHLCLSISQFKSFPGGTFLSKANFPRPGALSPCPIGWFLTIGQLTWAWTNDLVLLQIRSQGLYFFVKRDPAEIILNKRDVVIIRQTFPNWKRDFSKSCYCVLEKITINSFGEFILYLHFGAIYAHFVLCLKSPLTDSLSKCKHHWDTAFLNQK